MPRLLFSWTWLYVEVTIYPKMDLLKISVVLRIPNRAATFKVNNSAYGVKMSTDGVMISCSKFALKLFVEGPSWRGRGNIFGAKILSFYPKVSPPELIYVW
jgi:hypothetical protein